MQSRLKLEFSLVAQPGNRRREAGIEQLLGALRDHAVSNRFTSIAGELIMCSICATTRISCR